MATKSVFVYAPCSGLITGRDKYCYNLTPTPTIPAGTITPTLPCNGIGGSHPTCQSNWSYPLDVGGTGDIYLRVNYPSVKSIITWIGLYCCKSTTCDPDYKRAVIVELYGQKNGQCWIASIMYGHVKNPLVGNGSIYNLTGSTKKLGQNIGSTPCGACSTGAHSHMEIITGLGWFIETRPCCATFDWVDPSPNPCPAKKE